MNEPGYPLKRTLEGNIVALTERRRRERRQEAWSDRLADVITRFVGSMTFVGIHLALFGGWVAWNLLGSPKFDPSFVILAMVASVEAIFLSTFVLISQNREAAAADARADLDLHINLLAEHELSRLVALVGRMAERMGVEPAHPEIDEIEEDVSPDRVLDALKAENGPA